ncbi:type II toxin-antitoxin system MqsR family toxin [Komagataeibacter oboediens]|uniref:type II toxin-antitoxin system MqsR family toxin n=1 Tax=Komagataeibacter oboediens TaxID=65958 RepID=UPI001C2D1213|nr:type II toxin-antitoxin system MqsR family toxin [Komagataeibacter oboediens]
MSKPTYSLPLVKNHVNRLQARAFSRTAIQGLYDLGMLVSEAIDVINSIVPSMFHKTMESELFKGQFQDVYRAYSSEGIPLYVKFSLGPRGNIVVSFKER